MEKREVEEIITDNSKVNLKLLEKVNQQAKEIERLKGDLERNERRWKNSYKHLTDKNIQLKKQLKECGKNLIDAVGH